MSSPLDADAILGPEGRIAQRLNHYEHRPQQLQMAAAITAALQKGEHLIAEAGTGTGKSFAYLVPAILHATADQDESHPDHQPPEGKPKRTRRILISTHTISLQEQLINKDLPILNSVIPREFSAVLVKGRGNYVSLRRLGTAKARATQLMSYDKQLQQLKAIDQWTKSTNDGSLSTLPVRPDRDVWDEVQSDSGNCLGRKCKTYNECFYFKARRRANGAQILIVNHALFFSDLALRQQGVSILPDYDAVVLDECHTIEAVAGDHLGVRVTSGQVDYMLNKLYSPRTQKGLLVAHELLQLQEDVEQCRHASTNFFADLLDWWEQHGTKNGRVSQAKVVTNAVSKVLEKLAGRLHKYGNDLKNESDKKDFTSAHDRLMLLAGHIRSWNEQQLGDSVYWIEQTASRHGLPRVTLAAAPVDVGSVLREQLFQPREDDEVARPKSVILTSATLAVGKETDFSFFRSRVGLSGGGSLRVGSPFDYSQQAQLTLVTDLPDPSAQRQEFEKALPAQIRHYIAKTNGHAFILFTSYDLLRRCATALVPWCNQQGMNLYSQAGDQTRSQLLDAFRKNPRSVLFGTDSFWQGVDVPGDALQNVIITKLPFSVPDHPLLQARLEAIRESGGNPFRDYQLPEAVIKLRQGFGRLIRTATDSGIVVILDPRVKTKPYGRTFVQSLPDMKTLYASAADAKSITDTRV
ncbi:ATP-dependent DNA helicase [Roseimaritima ulvae]|uniref:DNA 5'-3' helicase n=1 Tax=Roseimaritima ulvae TaxID=980254 RepID=A0A5B9QH51_9BACT|nr:helicase C-terminal domain-containing protein [Roseimaritima ulvae]QEG38388.1 putative ATP-dependent helicase DinG [Roseimaritima ulvae]